MGVTTAFENRVLAHYDRVGPLLEKQFGGTPIVFANFPGGLDQPAHWHRTDVPLSMRKLLWLCHRMYAVEFHSWAPLPGDPNRLRFGRILLEHAPSLVLVKEAALAIRSQLFNAGLEALPCFDGLNGMALWVPFADAPLHEAVLNTFHRIVSKAVAAHPTLLTAEPNTHASNRVHVHVSSNAPGHFSALPYSARGRSTLPVCTPIHWPELGASNGPETVDTIQHRLAEAGDVFAEELAIIAGQRLADARIAIPKPLLADPAEPRGHVIAAAIDILEDGVARGADELLAEALKRKLVPPATKRKYVYSSLIEYIARSIGHDRKPPIVQDAQRRFRINEPPDDWPALDPLPPQPPPDEATTAVMDRLTATGTGPDPAAFELAVCDAFAHLGFAAYHVGGHGAPDGYADAQLGVLGYRVMLECKTAKSIVAQPDCLEASKFNTEYAADFCAIIGPDFGDELELAQELQTHSVTAITVSDLRTLLAIRANPLEIRTLLKPGFMIDRLHDLLWERAHGICKRLATVAHIVAQEGWRAQITAAKEGGAATAPLLTADAAMLLVDAFLRTQGSSQACTRADVTAAFTHLTDPLIAKAVWSDPTRTAIVIANCPPAFTD
ncbi:MAG TPA: hypothetical protein VIG51_07030 [Candidatus Baltobacteraceae bacterium]